MDLGRTQALSLVTKGITTALGIIQSLIVIRLLGPANFGLVGLVMSIGGVIGVSQHLGIVDGAIREIAILKNKREIGKVFWVSHLVRQLVTIPLSIALVLLSGFIAERIYGKPEITLFLQVFAAGLVLQGLQDVLGASLTGLKKFRALYGVQIATAAINIAVFGYLVWQFGITGFFWAVILTTAIMVGWFFVLIARELRGYLALPAWADIRQYGRKVLRIGAYMYLARIAFVVWQRLPLLLLGGVLAAEELGYLNVSLTFGSRLTIIAMALSEVNLSWMSSLFVEDVAAFRRVATRNMHRVFLVMFALTAGLMFFTPEIVQYIIGAEFIPGEPLIYVMTFAFFLYSLVDIGTSSVFVPADRPRLRAAVYAAKVFVSGAMVGWLLLFNPSSWLATWGVLAGAMVAYVATTWLGRTQFQIQFLSRPLWRLLAALGVSFGWLLIGPELWLRSLVFVVLLAWSFRLAKKEGLVPSLAGLLSSPEAGKPAIICFAGAEYDLPYWTNRQQVMSRVAKQYPVLYVEPRVWLARYVLRNWKNPVRILRFLGRLVGWERKYQNLYIISQWNLIPGSRESQAIAAFNHQLNRWRIKLVAGLLGFAGPTSPRLRGANNRADTVIWIYDTEAAEYLSAFPGATVLYDCVDDHAAQAGAERNLERVREEEREIMRRADIVTVTSQRLYDIKSKKHSNVHLVLNAGDVTAFLPSPNHLTPNPSPRLRRGENPVLGTVGALDAYKVDFELLEKLATQKLDWKIVLIGEPVIDRDRALVQKLTKLSNVDWVGPISHEKVPAYVHQFDVCLIPYRANQYNAASFPLKFWEFMATGKPIVVSGVPELEEYKDVIGYAHTADEFIQLCEEALRNRGDETARVDMAGEHSWEKRVERLLELLQETLRR